MGVKITDPEYVLDNIEFSRTASLLKKDVYDERSVRRRTAFIMDVWRYTSERIKERWGIDYCYTEVGHEQVKERFFASEVYKKFAHLWWDKLNRGVHFGDTFIQESEKNIRDANTLISSLPNQELSLGEIKNYLIRLVDWNTDAFELAAWAASDYIQEWANAEIESQWNGDRESLAAFMSIIYEPTNMLLVNREQQQLLKIALMRGEALESALKEHYATYRHIIVRNIDENSFDISHYRHNVALLKNEDEYDALKERLDILKEHIERSNRALETAQLSDNLKEKIRFIKWLLYYRTEISDYHKMINGSYKFLFLQLSNIFELPLDGVANMSCAEMIDGLEHGITNTQRTTIMKRTEHGYAYIVVPPPYKSFLVVEDEIDIVSNIFTNITQGKQIKELRGNIAFKGIVSGVARVIVDKRNTSELQENEILVTPMTSPEFFLGIKKCKGIVTNEGGIACHAAIMAREFGKPCIIGTKVATDVIKTGQYITVDADKGIILL